MAPHPHRVELDLDRKEELLIAKQLRACRVNILPRNVDKCYQISSLSPSPAPRTPASPNLQQQTSKDSSPIAMRYWNQCQSARDPENDNKERPATEQDVVDELAMKMQKLTQQKGKSASKVAALPTVPDIRNKMKETLNPCSPHILITDTEKRNVIPHELHREENKPKAQLPPKLPFLNDIHLLKQPELKSPTKHEDQVQTIPDLPVKKKINAHIGHIENRPKLGDLPFLNDIKNIGVFKPEATVDPKQIKDNNADTQQITSIVSRTLPTEQESAYVREKIQNDILKYNNDRKIKSPSPKLVRFSEKDITQNTSKRNSYAESYDNAPNEKHEKENIQSDLNPVKPPKTKKNTKFNIKIDEKSNMSKLSDQIIPQLNTIQKNYLGLLFFNELSQNIVEDIVAQQLSMMPGTKLASLINSLEQQVCDTAVPLMLNCVSDDLCTALVCDTFGDLNTQDKAGVLFTTGDDVVEVCSTITDFGGRAFKKALIKNMIANEDKQFMDEIVQEHLKDHRIGKTRTNEEAESTLHAYRDDQKQLSSADDENYNSAEESLEDVDDDEVYQYEYFDFENK